jgi:hypothetical protein
MSAPLPAEAELAAIRCSVTRGSPFGDETWIAKAVHELSTSDPDIYGTYIKT